MAKNSMPFSYYNVLCMFISCAVLLCTKLHGQACTTLRVDFSIEGFGDNATSVTLNSGSTYQLKNLSCGLCQYNAYTWTVLPLNGSGNTGYTISSSTALAPTISFSAPGSYTIQLRVVTTKNSVFWECYPDDKTTSKYAYVNVAYKTPVAQFSTNGSVVSSTTVSPNSTVNFADASSNVPSSWQWTISPASGWSYTSGSSTSKSPSVKFTTNGAYTVALKATNSAGTNTITKTNHINVTTIKPVADFNANGSSASQISVSQNSTVHFTDQSLYYPTAWSWAISPGTGWQYSSSSASSQHPSVTFTATGTYSVTLTASNSAGSNAKTKTSYIKITPPDPPVADFLANFSAGSPVAVDRGTQVTMYNSSTNSPTSFAWSISPASNWTYVPGYNASSESPKVIFNANGLYTVSLTAGNQYGSNTTTKANYISVSTPGNLVPPPHKHWDYKYGGKSIDAVKAMAKTADGGFILGGTSWSGLDGDKTQDSRGYSDYWIVKLDENGTRMWDKRFGGSGNDDFGSIQQTSDGGYIIGGTTNSPADGDISQGNRGYGSTDYWVLKLNAAGEKLWDKRFGGSEYETLSNVLQTADGGYIISGISNSPISGEKTQAPWDPNTADSFIPMDFWIVKTDASGNKQWDKRFGSHDEEYDGRIIRTSDGGYLVGGSSTGGATGDKTQANQAYTGGDPEQDYWVVKINSSGTKQWDKRFGGQKTNTSNGRDQLKALAQASNGDYILAGMTNSDVNGDVTVANRGFGATYDYWIVRINSSGTKVWDKRFGGTSSDELTNIESLTDGGYLLVGNTYSGFGGDKTDDYRGLYPNSTYDGWMLKINSTGVKQWDKTIGGSGTEVPVAIKAVGDTSIYVACNTSSIAVDGDITQATQSYDYWLVKFGNAIPPYITSISPNTGIPGDTVIISGTSFSNISAVKFSGVEGAIVLSETSTIKALVPFGAVTGFITVENNIGSINSKDTFFIPTPRITSFTPTTAKPGATIRLIGKNFEGTHSVYFNGFEIPSFTIDSSSQISLVLPDGARTGPITVISNAGKYTSTSNFTVQHNNKGVLEVCPGATVIITSNKTGTGTWQESNGAGFSDLYDNTNLAGTKTTSLTLKAIPSSWYGKKFRYFSYSLGSSDTITLRVTNYWNWLNGTSSQYENVANWGCGKLPDSNTDVIIEKGNADLRSIQTVRSIELKPGAGINILQGYQLVLTGKLN